MQGPSQLLAAAQSLAASLFQSSEYANRPGRATDNGLYVADLYYAYLQRGADDTGLSYWTNLTGSLGRAGVRNEFAWSGEFQTLVATLYGTSAGDDQRTDSYIRKFYLGAYGREPNSTEAAQQRSRLNAAATQGQSQVQAEAELMGREMFAAQVTNGSISTAQYVTNLYEGFLQRGPDTGGMNWWVGQAGGELTPQNPLDATKRQNVLNGFATASAAKELAGTLYREANWLVSDHLGTPRMVVEKSGSLGGVKRHDYLPFGEEIFAGTGGRTQQQGYSGDNSVRQKFTGYERDDETGLDYAINRYYSSTLGRFTGVDPYDINLERQTTPDNQEAKALFNRYISNPQRWNRYAYALNNPLKYIDPDGLAETLTVNLNIVYDKKQFTEAEAKKALEKQVEDLKQVYGEIDIEFNISYTAGTANSARTEITEGAKTRGINVFFSQDNNTFNNSGYNSSNGQLFITIGASQGSHPIGEGTLSHEVGHKLGITWKTGIEIGGIDIGNVSSDFDIGTSNARLRLGKAQEGVHWVDNYRNYKPWPSITRGDSMSRQGYRPPTTFDIYRDGARKLAGK